MRSKASRFALAARLTKFEGERTKAYDAANGPIRQSFLEYGQKRGPLMASIAVLVGWPRPQPDLKGRQGGHEQGSAEGSSTRAGTLGERSLNSISSSTDLINHQFAGAQAVICGQDGRNSRRRSRLFRDQLNKKADDETAKQVRATPKDLDIRLAGAPGPLCCPPCPAGIGADSSGHNAARPRRYLLMESETDRKIAKKWLSKSFRVGSGSTVSRLPNGGKGFPT